MPEIQRLRLDHGPALLAFEEENRAFFAASIPDRGNAYFARFDARHAALLAEQAAGSHHFHVVVGDGGEVLGRVNLFDVAADSAELGYRIAEKAGRRGLATNVVGRICVMAADEYGLTALRAATTVDNAGSRAVLARTGFRPVGEILLSGRPGIRYLRHLNDAPDVPAGGAER
ncbi:GNAT family N-acetyltransferase [Streptomyces sp. SID3343]|uniref:GNAT family N-acetyltransferase n=1 Tax=Streptomyces sp. SID3343 TaxID=2690260 RepID=UPI00136B1444|nr:GNAT family N-acetyltransferase [Streptomyces sp. SID3343]MYV97839.1 GNAT family N-acetyltransferase [Streptomyces sp. SID3343]